MAKKRTDSVGVCKLCRGEFSKSGMTRHLAKCLAEQEPSAPARGKVKSREIFHIRVEGSPLHWLHLELAADAQFGTLDAYLRAIWLECCGHCSAFRLRVPKPAAAVRVMSLWASLFEEHDSIEDMVRAEEELMAATLVSKVAVGDTFDYEYDFGSTTELNLTIVGKRDGVMRRDAVLLLARNLPPDIRCECGQPAVWVCTECAWEQCGWLCKRCGKKHSCGDEMFLPVVNSPRVGVCAYCGPDEGTLAD